MKVQGLFGEHREMCEMKLVGLQGHLNSLWGCVVVECWLWSHTDLSLNPAFVIYYVTLRKVFNS